MNLLLPPKKMPSNTSSLDRFGTEVQCLIILPSQSMHILCIISIATPSDPSMDKFGNTKKQLLGEESCLLRSHMLTPTIAIPCERQQRKLERDSRSAATTTNTTTTANVINRGRPRSKKRRRKKANQPDFDDGNN